ncbi:MAG: adenosine kinase [Dysgonamonadaceae bacterium]|jgi:sugar/nucleoside kinase (ribokinase family)|nr:adenosine kinase [Dysgonamonadaceae bacterium]
MKILGIGNALVDILAKLPNDELLRELNVAKGSMNLIDSEMRASILNRINRSDLKMTTGGSVSNTALAVRQMNVPVGYIGKVGDDLYGDFYIEQLKSSGVDLHLIYEKTASGTAIAMISPDGERTFCTYLGAAADMQKKDLKESDFEDYTHFYAEGYLVQNHELIETALKIAKSRKLTTMIDLASFNVVENDRDFIQSLIEKYVDIVFANEEEARALTGKPASEAVHEIAKVCKIAVVKEGSKGSLVKQDGQLYKIPVHEKVSPVDTTAAGDYYAAGFFYGMAHNADLEKCARIGSLLSYHIIQVVGTKLDSEIWDEIRRDAQKIIEK